MAVMWPLNQARTSVVSAHECPGASVTPKYIYIYIEKGSGVDQKN
jgi:hypothetical protein